MQDGELNGAVAGDLSAARDEALSGACRLGADPNGDTDCGRSCQGWRERSCARWSRRAGNATWYGGSHPTSRQPICAFATPS